MVQTRKPLAASCGCGTATLSSSEADCLPKAGSAGQLLDAWSGHRPWPCNQTQPGLRLVIPNAIRLAFGQTAGEDPRMWRRAAWQDRIEQAWRRKNVVWLMGVRRTGKTVFGRSLPSVEYLDCELPSVRRQLADPERFLAGVAGKRVVLDEIHRLDQPAE